MFRLDGKAALVTGASGGIGGAIARALHAQGARVAISGTREDALQALAAELGDGAVACRADLSAPDGPTALAAAAEEALGQVDILVNNAGFARDGLAMRMKEEDWRAVLEVNLTAAFRLIQALMRGMMKRRHGRVVSISSVVGATGNPGQANYVASKAGLVGLSKSLAAELAPRGITVNCVAPGAIDTAMVAALDDGQRSRILSAIPAGRVGTPAEVAAAVVYLASDEAAYVTGQTLHVNGGMAMI
ncbi:MAG: 3-oxoacyl-[acyl-carrier-protein] reductase [Acetobacterales bacterium]